MRKIVAGVAGAGTALALGLALPAAAAGGAAANGIDVKPWTYVGATGTDAVASGWVTHQGLPDAGNANRALYLQKLGPTSDDSSAGASVTGVAGTTLTDIGFDVRNDGHCGAGAPRFDVFTTDGVDHFFGCTYGSHTPINSDWTRVRFAPADAFPAVTPDETVQSVDVVFDEGNDQGTGSVYLDNIDYNGAIAGQPGLSK